MTTRIEKVYRENGSWYAIVEINGGAKRLAFMAGNRVDWYWDDKPEVTGEGLRRTLRDLVNWLEAKGQTQWERVPESPNPKEGPYR